MRITRESGSERLITPSGSSGASKRLGVALQHPTLRVSRGRAPLVVVLVGGELDPVVLLKPRERLEQTILPITRDRLRLQGAMRFQLAPRDPRPLTPAAATEHLTTEHQRFEIDLGICGRALLHRSALALLQPAFRVRQRLAATLRSAELLRQLIAPPILPVQPILSLIDLLRLAQNLTDQVPIGAVLIHRRVRLDLRPIDRDHPDRHQPGLPAQAEDIVKQLLDLALDAGGGTPRSSSDPASASR